MLTEAESLLSEPADEAKADNVSESEDDDIIMPSYPTPSQAAAAVKRHGKVKRGGQLLAHKVMYCRQILECWQLIFENSLISACISIIVMSTSVCM